MALQNVRVLTEAGVISEVLYRLQNPLGQWWGPMVSRFNSMHPEQENHGWLGGVPQMTEQTGDPRYNELRAATFIVRHKTWQAGVRVDKFQWMSKAAAQIQQRINEQTGVVLGHPGILLMNAIAAGETGRCYDGNFFFATDHSEGASGTHSNKISATAVAPANPTAAEMVDAILGAVEKIHSFKDDQGNECNMDAKEFIVAHPTGMTKSVIKALGAELIGGGDTNVVAGERSGFKFTGQVMPRYTGNKIAVFRRRGTGEGDSFIWQVFQDTAPVVLGIESEYCKEHGHLLFKQEGRYNLAYGRWQGAVQATFV